MAAVLIVLYGVISYVIFLITFVYAIAFVVDFGVPLTIDHGRSGVMPQALVIDIVLLGIFAAQHLIMARRGFKRWVTRWLPESMERSTFVLMASLALALLCWQWRPLPTMVWQVDAAWAYWLLYALCALGWLLVLTSTFAISHWDLFGLRQVWLRLRGVDYSEVPLKESTYYKVVRHPMMLGFLIAFWATPVMTAGHLLFALATTGYILITIKVFEERGLAAQHGDAYRDYQQKVPMICPWPRPRDAGGAQP